MSSLNRIIVINNVSSWTCDTFIKTIMFTSNSKIPVQHIC